MLEERLPEEHRPYLVALKALRDLKDMSVKVPSPPTLLLSSSLPPLLLTSSSPLFSPPILLPAAEDIIPATKETVPATKETVTAATETDPDAKETDPDAKETVPATKETVPANQETPPLLLSSSPPLLQVNLPPDYSTVIARWRAAWEELRLHTNRDISTINSIHVVNAHLEEWYQMTGESLVKLSDHTVN